MTTSRWRVPVAMACLALLLASCGDDEPASTADSSSTTASEGSTTTTAATDDTTATNGLLTLTPASYGALQLGMSVDDAEATGLLEPFIPGCELAGPEHLAATMVVPYDGAANADASGVIAIFVRSNVVTAPGGVKIGDPVASVETAFGDGYTVTVDKSLVDMFGEWFVNVSETGADEGVTVFQLTVAPDTGKVTTIGIPHIPTCE